MKTQATKSPPVYFQIQYKDVHSDGCCPVGHNFPDGGNFRKFAHDLLDEFLNAYERGEIDPSEGNLLEAAHVIFGICSSHNHAPEKPESHT
jgi:hypothetical protein